MDEFNLLSNLKDLEKLSEELGYRTAYIHILSMAKNTEERIKNIPSIQRDPHYSRGVLDTFAVIATMLEKNLNEGNTHT